MSDTREAIDALFDRPDRTEWTDSDAADKLAAALYAVLNLCDTTAGPRSGVGSRLVSAEDIRTAIQTALGDTTP